MGGDKNRMERSLCALWEESKELWTNVVNDNLEPYVRKIHGQDHKITDRFVKSWSKGVLSVYGAEFKIDEPFIAEVIGLSMEGKKFYRERKKSALSIFYDKQSERSIVRKNMDEGYNRKDLLTLWADIAEFIMRYITLDGRYASIVSYHLTILNHFRLDVILFSFFS